MATTGTNTFTVTRDDIIKAALRNLGALGVGETPITEDYTNCSQALNIMIKGWAKKGLPLHVTEEVSIALTAAKVAYTIGPTGSPVPDKVAYKPLRILEGSFIRDTNGIDTPMTLISRQEYNALGDKDASSVPNQLYYDPGTTVGTIYVFGESVDATHTLYIQSQRQFQDMTAGSDNFDFPQEWFQALKWGLSAELSAEYGVTERLIPYFEQKSAMFLEECFGWSQETASVFFTPDQQMLSSVHG